jgi:hypothetical protein
MVALVMRWTLDLGLSLLAFYLDCNEHIIISVMLLD